MRKATLYIFSGLPGSGKPTLSRKLAGKIHGTFLRIDTVEQGLKDICKLDVEAEGYRLSHRIAKDNLEVGNDVVADSVNPIDLSRVEWNNVALESGAQFVNIEIACSDEDEHRRRAEQRDVGIRGLKPPTWSAIKNRDYDKWTEPRVFIETAGKTVEESFEQLIVELDLGSG